MLIRATFFALLLMALALPARAAQQIISCDVCSKPIHGKYYKSVDQATGAHYNVCDECKNLNDHCTLCNRPVKTGGTTLADGRVFCARDAKNFISSEDEAVNMFWDSRKDLDRLLSRYMSFPETNVLISMVNPFYLNNLMRSQSEEQPCVGFFGVTTCNNVDDGRRVHSVAILNHLLPVQLRHTAAHELTHAWINQNLARHRRKALDKDTEEGFCELIAYKYMEFLHESWDMEQTRKNPYSKGKIAVLLEADARFGFDALLDWVKFGDDVTLESDKLERVRAINGQYVPNVTAPQALPAFVALPAGRIVTPALSELTLQSVSGTQAHRFAIVNNRTFEAMEKGKVSVGNTNFVIQCLTIDEDAALIQIQGSNEKKLLKLKSSAK